SERTATAYTSLATATATVKFTGVGQNPPAPGLYQFANTDTVDPNVSGTTVLPGHVITYTLYAFNDGPTKLSNAVVTIRIVTANGGAPPAYVAGSLTLNGRAVSDRSV